MPNPGLCRIDDVAAASVCAWIVRGCGIVLSMPVLRMGMCDSIQPNCGVPTTIEYVTANPQAVRWGRAGRTMQMAAEQ